MRRLSCALLFFAAASSLAAEVYRSVDENGVVVYSDRPDREGTERVFVATTRPPTPTPRPAASASKDEPSSDPEAIGAETRLEPSAQEVAEERRKNCEIARERAERYRASRRLYRNTSDGEREYLSDAEIDEARASANADVERWCN